MKSITLTALVALAIASTTTACRKDEVPTEQAVTDIKLTENNELSAEIEPAEQSAEQSATGSSAGVTSSPTQWTTSRDMNVPIDQIDNNLDLAAVLGDRDIPYPVYPNGNHYRIGNENGLTIIVFETEDTFEEVDAFYQVKAGLPRLSAMKDYVRYSTREDDRDPWETSKPGIVIHEFKNETERLVAGAKDESRTNIIMSFK